MVLLDYLYIDEFTCNCLFHPHTLPLDQLEAFFAEAKRSGVFELYYTELSAGLRRGELLGIRWETDAEKMAAALSLTPKSYPET